MATDAAEVEELDGQIIDEVIVRMRRKLSELPSTEALDDTRILIHQFEELRRTESELRLQAASDLLRLDRAKRAAEDQVERLTALIRNLLDNDPNEVISDGGHTVLESWRYDAERAIRPPSDRARSAPLATSRGGG